MFKPKFTDPALRNELIAALQQHLPDLEIAACGAQLVETKLAGITVPIEALLARMTESEMAAIENPGDVLLDKLVAELALRVEQTHATCIKVADVMWQHLPTSPERTVQIRAQAAFPG